MLAKYLKDFFMCIEPAALIQTLLWKIENLKMSVVFGKGPGARDRGRSPTMETYYRISVADK